jgi:exosome complex component RRP42
MKTTNITKKRIEKYLAEGKRFDERKPEEFRDITIETGISKKAEGSARVKIGKTEVIVGVKLDVSEPYPDSPDKGNLMTTAELTPLSSERISLGRPGIDSIELGRVIDRGIRESKFIEFEKLCIKEGEKVWNVFIDIYSINDDGNLLDAAGIGAVVALKDAYLPKYDEKTERVVYGELTKNKMPLSKNITFPVTVHKVGNDFLIDPTREEEDIVKSRVTIGMNKEGIASMQKGKEGSLSVEEFDKVLDTAEKAWAEVFKKIEKYIK